VRAPARPLRATGPPPGPGPIRRGPWLLEHAAAAQPVGHVRNGQALLTERGVPEIVAAHEPDAQLPVDWASRQLEPFARSGLDQVVVWHRASVARCRDAEALAGLPVDLTAPPNDRGQFVATIEQAELERVSYPHATVGSSQGDPAVAFGDVGS